MKAPVISLREPTQAELDASLEREIETAHRFAMKYVDKDPALAREAFSIMARLIGRRSREQIERMEVERSL
jgi:hypothetical protein